MEYALEGGAARGAGGDLRALLREKAAGHSSFYRRLAVAPGGQPGSEPGTELASQPASQPASRGMSGAGALLRPPARAPAASPDEGLPRHDSSSDDEDRRHLQRPDRPRSADSAVDLEETPSLSVLADAIENIVGKEEKPCTGYDSGGENAFDESSPYEKRDYCEEHDCYHIRSRTILEAQYVEYPFQERKCSFEGEENDETDVFSGDGARRPSTLSWAEDMEMAGRARMVRTPSVVVSDYSDDIHAGITAEELEYFKKHVEAASPSSGRSSCSNLDSRCGSQLSVLEVDAEDSACGSQLSVDLDDKGGLSPSVSDCEDDDSGLGRQASPRKIPQ